MLLLVPHVLNGCDGDVYMIGSQSDLPDYLSGILGGGTAGSLDLGLDVNDMMPDLDSLLPTDF